MNSKTVVVTGASGGIGSELCVRVAAAGMRLVLLDRSPAKSQAFAARLETSYPGSVLATLAVDLADHADVARVARDVLAAAPTIDALFNNAGVLTETLQFSAYGNELHFEVNVLAPLHLTDALRPALRAAGGAVVVNTSAGLALGVKTLTLDELVRPATFSKLFGPYARSKEALNVVGAALAREFAADRIVVRGADPGPVRTALTKGAGTPLWMRLFYGLLPTAATGAGKIFDAGFSSRWAGRTGVFISGGKIAPLPPAIASDAFGDAFLHACRERASAVAPRPATRI